MEGALLLDHPPPIRKIGVYDLVAEIGRVGMTDVYFALGPPIGGRRSRVVIKRFLADELEDDDYRDTFLDEARLARRLRHPNIVDTMDVGRDGRSYFMVMEFLDGQPLSRLRRHAKEIRRTPLAIELRIVSDVLAGLQYMHETTDEDGTLLDVVHRDVTPQNVFITYDGEVKIVDFGLAKSAAGRAETRMGVVKGTLSYLAPENVSRRFVDPRSDIFAAGVILWEGATGRRFWDGIDEPAILHRLVSGDLPTAEGACEMPTNVFHIAQRALAPDPADRFASAREMRQAIEMLLTERPESSTHAVSGYVQRLFVEERRCFYQSARAAVARLESRERSIGIRDADPSSTLVANALDVPESLPAVEASEADGSSDDGQTEPESVRTSIPVTTTFASPSLIPAPIVAPPTWRRIGLGIGAASLLGAVWVLAPGRSHEHHVTAQEATRPSAHVTLPKAALAPAPSFAPAVPAPALSTSLPPSSAQTQPRPPRPKAGPRPPARGVAQPKSRTPGDQFGI